MSKFTFESLPQLRILSNSEIEQMHENAIHVLERAGVAFACEEALDILEEAGCVVERNAQRVKFHRELIERCIQMAPSSFDLYDRDGNYYCKFGDSQSRFNPGSCSGLVLADDGKTVRPSTVADLKLITKVAQHLPQIDFVSSSVVCEEAPGDLGSQYLYYTEMKYSTKPIIGGATDVLGVPRTFKLLEAVLGSEKNVLEKPYSIFDICVTSPMTWSHIGAKNIIDCAKRNIPIELISAQIAGATGPISIAGCILQHTVELLSGLILAQIVRPGTAVSYGGAPCIFNMRTMYTPMAAMESNMITAGYALMGKYYGLPTHTYAALSDSKEIDYQAGSETARSGLLALQLGIDNISGAGGLNVIAEMSVEKLIMDAEYIGTLKHFAKGITFNETTLANELICKVGPAGNYMKEKHTLKWFKKEHNYDNLVMNYQERASWKKDGGKSIFEKAKEEADRIKLLPGIVLSKQQEENLDKAFIEVCLEAGLSRETAEELIAKCNEA
ncbi:trimethylamine methyltransferase family protein [Sinanaerobacter sp. ZZT-01]|uniref:trimethylamine methyltransferase family protein n=1 Tax=Sinanaerobacter sp. ZZT-01 TaxID=3111540 RepID=UPI002D770870|nr:trimethylamine methyltransferase family protein [Sinanaerobacter sp. ZZT-01]WRR94829.1 trimethylamine methyltransferase family protein [Sinanaerobacter sp. ZZT-01]